MGLNDFTVTKERALPIFIVADTSGSMEGMKINAVNKAIQDMITTFRNVDDVRGAFKVSIITFGGEKVIVHQYPTNVNELTFNELHASGRTPMGEAISIVSDLIEDKEIVTSRDFAPTVILISDGFPTDYPGGYNVTLEDYLNWEPIKKLHKGNRGQKCMRVAISVDLDTDINMLKAFLNNGTEPISAVDATDIAKVFKWITMSTISRMNSVNPNDLQSFLRFEDEDEDEVLI